MWLLEPDGKLLSHISTSGATTLLDCLPAYSSDSHLVLELKWDIRTILLDSSTFFFCFFFVLYWYIFTTSNLQGIWSGMIGGICLQTLILIVVTSLTNWRKEVSIFTLLHSLFHFWSLELFIVFIVETESNLQADQAESRVKKWGGSTGEHWSLFRRVTSLLRDHWQLDTCTTVLSNFRGVKYYVTPSSWITHHCAIFRSAFGHSILFCLGVLCTFKIF